MIKRFESGTLFSKEEWESYVDKLKTQTDPSSKPEVADALLSAVKKRIPKEKFGLFLSGGLDSNLLSILLKKCNADFTAYCVGIKGSPDIKAAEEIASFLNIPLKSREFSEGEVLECFLKARKILPDANFVALSIASVFIAASELAKEDGVSTVFTGLGSEEIFAGYHRHSLAKDINAECWRGLRAMYDVDLTRDFALSSALGLKVLVPFLDEKVIRTAMGISDEKKIVDGRKKVILSEIAEDFGVPKHLAWRKKLAAQYGSGFDRVLERLAKKSGKNKSELATSLLQKPYHP